ARRWACIPREWKQSLPAICAIGRCRRDSTTIAVRCADREKTAPQEVAPRTAAHQPAAPVEAAAGDTAARVVPHGACEQDRARLHRTMASLRPADSASDSSTALT